ncbi:MAG: OmpW family outer membrane protein [Roseovarius sp.]|nr:OmpW family outer membrane protein [Roseovarius sp.]
MKKTTAFTLAVALATAAAPALAQEQGDMTLGLGMGYVAPDDSYSSTSVAGLNLRAGDNARPTLTFEYFVADNVGIEVLAAWPFEHDIEAQGTGDIGSTKHLPPTLSLQYHFTNDSGITPFIGAGLNYTTFWDDKLDNGAALSLDDSWGLALHAGVDFAVSDRAAIRTDVRWIDIETDANVGGADIGKVKIDPWVFGVSYVMKF